MCGVVGVLDAEERMGAQDRVRAMLNSMLHRGPDDNGVVEPQLAEATFALGACRLAIQDLSYSGHQPMVHEGSGNVLVFNGEIYNAPGLRSHLERLGHQFRGSSDTEVVFRGYIQWGEHLFSRLRGMFGLAVWDAQHQQLVLARDPLGIKPLYYFTSPRRFAFASEIRALQAGGLPSTAVDAEALRDYLAYGAIQDPHTIYASIRSLLPGHVMKVSVGAEAVEPVPFWSFPRVSEIAYTSIDDVLAEGRQLLTQSVRRHLLSDVPVGVFLSSGLDSSLILQLAAEVTEDAASFTVTFPDEPAYDEARMAQTVAQAAGSSHTECPVSSPSAVGWAIDGLAAVDQPTVDGINTFIVSRAVKEKGLKVALSGMGGDELFGGYRTFSRVPRAHKLLQLARRLPPPVRVGLVRSLAARKGDAVREKLADMAAVGPDLIRLYLQSRRLFSDRWMRQLGVAAPTRLPIGVRGNIVSGDAIASISRLETSTYLRNMLLRDGDVFGMANSLEIRVPILDQDLAEWALGLPGEVLLPHKHEPKFLLRKMFPDLLLEEQLQQAKRGFVLPLAAWLRGPLASVRKEGLMNLQTAGVVDAAGVKGVDDTFSKEPTREVGARLWALVVLGHWLANNPN